MSRVVAFLAVSATLVFSACVDESSDTGTADAAEPTFRVRADFDAPLNADLGWAGDIGENVTVEADRPFRLRFEAARSAAGGRSQRFALQYRRNDGDWTAVEAHDFPYPLREVEIDFGDVDIGGTPEGWRVISGDAGTFAVVGDERGEVLRASGDAGAVIGLYAPPWPLDAFSFGAEYRLDPDGAGVAGLVFGYVDADNQWRLIADAGQGRLRVGRVVDGEEAILAERAAAVVTGEWLTTEVQVEDGALEVTFGDDALEFEMPVDDALPESDLGVFVPAGGRADFRAFAIEGEPATPRVSIVSTAAYRNGDVTLDLLPGAAEPFEPGTAVSLSSWTPAFTGSNVHTEVEWPLVIRKFADGAAMNETGDAFEFRMVAEDGRPVGPARHPVLTLEVPAGHLGGTFVETPGRIGPWQASNGDLYFIMEPAESDNLFMMVKSTDGGQTFREVNGANRPATGDLESVDGRQVGDTIHIVHQVTESVRYHAFRTSDHPTHPDTWAVTDEQAATVTARSQMASLVVRPDGSMVAFHLGDTVGYAVRSPDGDWSDRVLIENDDAATHLAGPQAVLGKDGEIHLAGYRSDGTIWYRRLLRDGGLTPAQQLAVDAGTGEDAFGAVLPLVYLPESDTVVVIYRLADGKLWERRVTGSGQPAPAVAVTKPRVVQNAVDSQQPGADAVAAGGRVHVLFIDEDDRNVYSTRDEGGDWQPAELQTGGILGSWVRGNVYVRPDGTAVYGYVYDAGSRGGAGMNRFSEVVLQRQNR